MGATTPLIKAQSALPALGRARPGQPDELSDGSYRATLVFGSNIPRTEATAQAQDAARRQGAASAARPAPPENPAPPRSWSYLATEGGKGKAARRR